VAIGAFSGVAVELAGLSFWGLWNFFWLLFFLIALASPFETLGWWAGWSRSRPPGPLSVAAPAGDGPFLAYLTGVAGFSGDFLSRRERGFLERLAARLPGVAIVDDVFPFSANNNPLDGDRLLRWLWVWLQRWRLRVPNNVFDVLIIMRNVAQTLVSADPRYGPVYNLGVARCLARSLTSRGHTVGQPVYLVAYSGGAQIGVGAAPYLRELLGGPVFMISLGGVLTDDPGIDAVEQLVDLKGDRDHLMPALGWLFFPGRWRIVPFSHWNRCLQAGRIRWRSCGPMAHIGAHDYFSRKATLSDGRSHADASADLVAEIISGLTLR
jgi:hypothetical protein